MAAWTWQLIRTRSSRLRAALGPVVLRSRAGTRSRLARLRAGTRSGLLRLRALAAPAVARLRTAVQPATARLRVVTGPATARLRVLAAPVLARLRARAPEVRRAVSRFVEPRLEQAGRFVATRLVEPALARARRLTAFRAAERALRRAVRIATPWARELAAPVGVLVARIGLRDRLGVRHPARTAVAVGVLCCLGLMAVVEAASQPDAPAGASVTGPGDQVALSRPDQSTGSDAHGDDSPNRSSRSAERDRPGSGRSASDTSDEPAPLADTAPVAGLSQVQMDNARAIVRTGRDMGMPRRALVIGVATAMQESNLLNRASDVLPDSKRYPHQGTGWDHDSVGLFQQRTSSGWGPVHRLMDPAYATSRFFEALRQVPGWERMRLTEAAQAVQVSAYPEHYAKHEGEATEVVDALVPAWR